ncbi:TetR/AcrR family transcriptional regulator [Streptomyces tsukubensis]|uniref:TetR/AcrR family transcriptional regulator n=1 Tax=Streptomyces tsukubensis TaxID=83656 RepID=UPI00098F9842|nr:TetR/AcrR family transcriptional regulator [Streptomyces tsukubensis]QFR96156.1 TetR family transcriptional regulator [Streptomyces tsukubensis]
MKATEAVGDARGGAPAPAGAGAGLASGGASTPDVRAEDRRQRKARQTREALAGSALELIVERGLADVTVEAIAERADVTRRTFSRHFAGKEDAALDFVRHDVDRINAALRARPATEPPLLAYRRAVAAWLADPDLPGWDSRPYAAGVLALVDREPALFAAYERVRVDAQDQSVRIIADRLGADPDKDLRPGVVVGAAAGVLTAALRLWVRTGREGTESLPELVERAYEALAGEAAVDDGPPSRDTGDSVAAQARTTSRHEQEQESEPHHEHQQHHH